MLSKYAKPYQAVKAFRSYKAFKSAMAFQSAQAAKAARTIIDVKKVQTRSDFANIYAGHEFKKVPNILKNGFEDRCVTMINVKFRSDTSSYQDALLVFAEQCGIHEIPLPGGNWRQVVSKSIEAKSSVYSIIGGHIHMVLTKEVLEKFNGLVETKWDFYNTRGVDAVISGDREFHRNVATDNFMDMKDCKVALMKRARRFIVLLMEACLRGEPVKLGQSKIYPQHSIKTFGKDLKEKDIEDPTGVIKRLTERDGYPATFVLKGVALDKLTLTPGIDNYVVKDEKGAAASSVISVLPKVGFVQALIDVKKFKLSGGGTDSNAQSGAEIQAKEIIVKESKLSAGGSEDNAQSGAENVEEDVVMYVGIDLKLLKELFENAK